MPCPHLAHFGPEAAWQAPHCQAHRGAHRHQAQRAHRHPGQRGGGGETCTSPAGVGKNWTPARAQRHALHTKHSGWYVLPCTSTPLSAGFPHPAHVEAMSTSELCASCSSGHEHWQAKRNPHPFGRDSQKSTTPLPLPLWYSFLVSHATSNGRGEGGDRARRKRRLRDPVLAGADRLLYVPTRPPAGGRRPARGVRAGLPNSPELAGLSGGACRRRGG